MSAFDYNKTAAAVKRVLGRFGATVTFTRTDNLGTTSAFTATAVMVDTVKHTLGDSGIAIGDDRLLVEADQLPQPGDRVDYNMQSRVIVDPVIAVNPAGTRVLVECYARAG